MPNDSTRAWELIERARDGDRDAFAELYDRYVNLVFRFILFRVPNRDRELTEDLTGETFLRALRGLATYRNRVSDPGAWFVTIARNLVLDYLKSSYYQLTVLGDDNTTTTASQIASRHADPDLSHRVAHDDALNQVGLILQRCMAELTPLQREVVALRFLAGLEIAETAEVMRSNVGAIKAAQHRGMKALAELVPAQLPMSLRYT